VAHHYKKIYGDKLNITTIPQNKMPSKKTDNFIHSDSVKSDFRNLTHTNQTEGSLMPLARAADFGAEQQAFSVITPLSECTVLTSYWKKPYELTMNASQFSILSLFETENEISLDFLLEKLNVAAEQVEYALIVRFINSFNVDFYKSLIAVSLLTYEDQKLSLNKKFKRYF
jgi:hypothetical protein